MSANALMAGMLDQIAQPREAIWAVEAVIYCLVECLIQTSHTSHKQQQSNVGVVQGAAGQQGRLRAIQGQHRTAASTPLSTLFVTHLQSQTGTMQLSAQRSASAATQRSSRTCVVPKCSMRVTPFVARNSQTQFSSACSSATAGSQLQVRRPCGIDSRERPPHSPASFRNRPMAAEFRHGGEIDLLS